MGNIVRLHGGGERHRICFCEGCYVFIEGDDRGRCLDNLVAVAHVGCGPPVHLDTLVGPSRLLRIHAVVAQAEFPGIVATYILYRQHGICLGFVVTISVDILSCSHAIEVVVVALLLDAEVQGWDAQCILDRAYRISGTGAEFVGYPLRLAIEQEGAFTAKGVYLIVAQVAQAGHLIARHYRQVIYREAAPWIGTLVACHGALGHMQGCRKTNIKSILACCRHALGIAINIVKGATIESIVSNARHAPGDVDGFEAAITESIVPNARQLRILGDGDVVEFEAISESSTFNARHALGDVDGGEFVATIESISSNACQLRILGDSNGGEVLAILENSHSNARHALGNGDSGEAAANIESIVSNTRHALGDDGGRATPNQGIAACFYESITIVARIVEFVTFCHNDGGEAATILESTASNARHARGDGDGGEAAATLESSASNARHALGDGDGGEAAAITESPLSNARHTLGDVDGGEAATTLESTVSNARNSLILFCSFVTLYDLCTRNKKRITKYYII